MSLFHPTPQKHLPSFGLDIGSAAIRLAFMSANRGQQHVLKIACETAMPVGLIDEGTIVDIDRVASLTKELLAQTRHYRLPKYVVASLPDEQCYILMVTLAKKDTESLDESLRWEITQHVPFSVDELYLDWCSVAEDDNQQTFQVAAAPKTVVDAYATVVEKAGLTPIGMEAAALASLRSLALPKKGLSLVLSIGWTSTTLLLLTNQGVPISLETPVFSGRRLTEILMEQLKLKPNEAEKAKYVCGLEAGCSQGVVRHALWPEFTALVDACRRLQDYAAELYPKEHCQELVLTGGCSMVKSLTEELRLKTRLTIQKQALLSITIPNENHKPLLAEHNIPGYTTVFGLALAQP